MPPGFDDSGDEDGQVHPVARRLFCARTTAEVFAKAQQWVSRHDNVFVVDVSWDYMHDEPEPFSLSLYLTFELEPEDD
ncbi:hypothetical protein ACFHW2_23075 [Actinomadura sp. LOL_016]|uniref:hypothetical protein n=1 Tax=unclassified Actinomadura TaxID=2626254 RepID=UPI003A803ADE